MFPPNDLTRMRATQQAHMPDTCHRSVHSYLDDDYGQRLDVWTENTTDIECGIEQNPGSEQLNPTESLVFYDATIRLPISQAELWDVKDRLILTKRFYSSITPITYEAAAPMQVGPSGVRLVLRKVVV